MSTICTHWCIVLEANARGLVMQVSLRDAMREEDGIAVDVWPVAHDKISVKPIYPTPIAFRVDRRGDPPMRTVVLTWRDGAVTVAVKVSLPYEREADKQLMQMQRANATVITRVREDECGDVWAVFSIPTPAQTKEEWTRDALPTVLAFCGFAVRENILRHRVSSMFAHASVRSSDAPDVWSLGADDDEARRLWFSLRVREDDVNRLLISPSHAVDMSNAAAAIAVYHDEFRVEKRGISTRFERLDDVAPALAAVYAIALPLLGLQ